MLSVNVFCVSVLSSHRLHVHVKFLEREKADPSASVWRSVV